MNCKKCGGRIQARHTVTEGNSVFRIRHCLECGKVFYTEEKECSSFVFHSAYSRYRNKKKNATGGTPIA